MVKKRKNIQKMLLFYNILELENLVQKVLKFFYITQVKQLRKHFGRVFYNSEPKRVCFTIKFIWHFVFNYL